MGHKPMMLLEGFVWQEHEDGDDEEQGTEEMYHCGGVVDVWGISEEAFNCF